MRSLCFLFAAAAVLPPLPAQQGLDQAIDRYAAPLAEGGWLSGTLLVARGDEILYQRSWGLANAELGVALSPETVFNIASVTKPMTIVVGARLIEQGKLRLEDTLARWIPDFPRGDEITVDHLLNHRSGIPHRVTTDQQEREPRTAADMVELAKLAELAFEPGAQESYSSAGFSVLARVLELAGGKPFPDLLQEYVFGPAGMQHSYDVDSSVILPGRACAYQWGAGGKRNAPLQDLSFLAGAGSVWSTPQDLYRMQRSLVQGKLGSRALEALRRKSGMTWNGATSGFRAFVDHRFDLDSYVVFAGNIASGAADLLRDAVPRMLAGETVEPPSLPEFEPAEVALEVLRGYEGAYELRPGRTLKVHAEEGCLRIGDWVLLPASPTLFFSPQDFAEITIVPSAEGRPARLDWRNGETVTAMPRVGNLPQEP